MPSFSRNRIGQTIGRLTPDETADLNRALRIQLALDAPSSAQRPGNFVALPRPAETTLSSICPASIQMADKNATNAGTGFRGFGSALAITDLVVTVRVRPVGNRPRRPVHYVATR